MITRLLFIYIASLYCILIAHELIHLFTARFLKYKARVRCINILAFKVEYINKHKPVDNLLIAGISPVVLFIIGIFIPLNFYTLLIKLMCVGNFFNLFPITADGEIILLSIFQIFKRRHK